MMNKKKIKERLEYLRTEIKAERISYEEIVELQSLKKHIEPDDTLLLEWAEIKEQELEEIKQFEVITKKDIGKIVNYIQPDILEGGNQRIYQGIFMGFDTEYELCMIKCKNGRVILKNELQVWVKES